MVKIAPSIAAGDHGNLSLEAAHLQDWGADWIHVDIMDGQFAPNLTFGPASVKAIRNSSKIPLDCHLMISNPELFCERFLQAGGDIMTVHAETLTPDSLVRIEKKVNDYNAKLGVAFKPATDLSSIDLSGREISLITLMTVNPGFSGQKFMPEILPKIELARELFPEKSEIEIEVDGGVDKSNAKMIVNKGASVLVTGNSVFGQKNPEAALRELKMLVGGS
jgi:ribulose-phosphate 3-epimerase